MDANPMNHAWSMLVATYRSVLETDLYLIRSYLTNYEPVRPGTYTPRDMWTSMPAKLTTLPSFSYSLFDLPREAMPIAERVCEMVREWYPRLRLVDSEASVDVPFGLLTALEGPGSPEVKVEAGRTEAKVEAGRTEEPAPIDKEFTPVLLVTVPYTNPFPGRDAQDLVDSLLERIRNNPRPTFVRGQSKYVTLEELGNHNVLANAWNFTVTEEETAALINFIAPKIIGEYFENANEIVGRFGLALHLNQIEGYYPEEKMKRPWPNYLSVNVRDPEGRRPHTRRAEVTEVIGLCI